MGTRVPNAPGGEGWEAGHDRGTFRLQRSLENSDASPHPLPGGLDAQGPGPSSPGVSLFTQFNASPQGWDGLLDGMEMKLSSSHRGEKQGLLSRRSSDTPAVVFPCPSSWFRANSLWAERCSCPGGEPRVTHGELGSPFPSREEHGRGCGCPPARPGGSQGRKMGIFTCPGRVILGPDTAPLSPRPARRR